MANSYFNENTLEELIEEIKYVYKSDDRPWVIGYSGGKDSTTVVELVYKMLLGLDPDDRHKNVYIVSSDTLIENPLIKIYLSKMNDLLGQAADRDGLPIKSAMVTPPPNNSFWANVIGRGFPTPRMNGTFRWCTDRLKINPSGEYIQRVIDEEGKEVSKQGMIARQIIYFIYANCAVLGLGRAFGWFYFSKAKMVVLMEVLIIGVYVTVNLIVYVNDHMVAESMNQKLKEMRKRKDA